MTAHDDDLDYLFSEPQPVIVPAEWLDELSKYTVVSDPDYELPWTDG